MKIYKNLFNNMVSPESLLTAWNEFKIGKRNKIDVQIFELHLGNNIFSLHRDLISKKYKHGSYTDFYIHDPKARHIHKAEVRDRVVHHALFRCLNSVFEPSFINDSYSCRKGKGTHLGVKQLQTFTRKVYQTHGQCFVLKCDIKKFFPTIDHKILFNIIAKRIKDDDVLWLVKMIIESFSSEFSGVNKKGALKHCVLLANRSSLLDKTGAPIGNLTSQLFANIYMNEFDQHVKHNLKVKHYIRYTDDFVIIHYDQCYLFEIKEKINDFLKDKLKLSLHPNKVSIRKYRQGVDFLGYVSLYKASVLRTKTKHRIFKKLKERVQKFRDGGITEKTLLQSFNSYLGVLSHADCYGLEQELRHKFWEWLKEPK